MSDYEQLKPSMDAQVDARLGDSITYLVAGVPIESAPGVPTIPGFLTLLSDAGGFDGIQPHQERWNCKVSREFLPDGPDLRHRIQSPKLIGTYRPTADTPAEAGDYWLFDIQRA